MYLPPISDLFNHKIFLSHPNLTSENIFKIENYYRNSRLTSTSSLTHLFCCPIELFLFPLPVSLNDISLQYTRNIYDYSNTVFVHLLSLTWNFLIPVYCSPSTPKFLSILYFMFLFLHRRPIVLYFLSACSIFFFVFLPRVTSS